MRLRRILLPSAALFTLFVGPPALLPKNVLTVTPGKTKVTFTSKAPLEEIRGTGRTAEGELDLDTKLVRVQVHLTDFVTGLRRRDEHMHERYLHSDRFPHAEFLGKLTSANETTGIFEATGTLDLHGIKSPLTVTGRFTKVDDGYVTQANFKILLSDYAIEIPSVVIMKLANEIAIDVQFHWAQTR